MVVQREEHRTEEDRIYAKPSELDIVVPLPDGGEVVVTMTFGDFLPRTEYMIAQVAPKVR